MKNKREFIIDNHIISSNSEKQIITSNGVNIYYYPNEHLHSFCISLYLKSGPMYEIKKGISHFFEHVLFKNINKIFNGSLYQILDQYSINFDGFSYKEFIEFKIYGFYKNIKNAIDIISKIYEPIIISINDFNTENDRIKAEITEENTGKSTDDISHKIIWKGTSLDYPITGTKTDIDKINLKNIKDIQNDYLSSNNSFWYMTGNFNNDDILYLKKSIEKYRIIPSQLIRNNVAPYPDNFFNKNNIKIIKDDVNKMCFCFDFNKENKNNSELNILFDLLFSYNSGILYDKLSEKEGLIYSYDATIEEYSNIGNLHFSFEYEKDDILILINKVIDILNDIKNNLKSLQNVIHIYTDRSILLLDNAEDLNWNMAYENHILSEDYKDVYERGNLYKNITSEKIKLIASEIYKSNNLVLVIKSSKNIKEDKIRNILKKLD